MADTMTFTGPVVDVEEASKGQWKVLIKDPSKEDFNKTFRIWPTVFASEDREDDTKVKNPALSLLENNKGKTVTITYHQEDIPNRQTKKNVIDSVEVAGGQGAAPSESAPQSASAPFSASERKRFAVDVAKEVVAMLRPLLGANGEQPEAPAAEEGAEPTAPLSHGTYESFAAAAVAEEYGEKALDKFYLKLFPERWGGWRFATEEELKTLAASYDISWEGVDA